ncbi:hypothetical protein [Methylobacterium sp. B4]|uniref:hypothetical protein n=1 Tax=Methylobacterium sp. B4 TaxID=1938755 RepID=UPI0011B588DE|nr:hypothetical protein [Methylobacterium sp. B4]
MHGVLEPSKRKPLDLPWSQLLQTPGRKRTPKRCCLLRLLTRCLELPLDRGLLQSEACKGDAALLRLEAHDNVGPADGIHHVERHTHPKIERAVPLGQVRLMHHVSIHHVSQPCVTDAPGNSLYLKSLWRQRHLEGMWWARQDSNLQPDRYEE